MTSQPISSRAEINGEGPCGVGRKRGTDILNVQNFTQPNFGFKKKYAKKSVIFSKGLGTVEILYSRISLVFHNEFSFNGRAGLMLLLSLSLLLAKNRFLLSDLAGRLSSSSQVLGHCISCSRGIENTVNMSLLHIPGCPVKDF